MDILFKRKKDRKSISVWFAGENEKFADLYYSLNEEYGVDTPKEARKAIIDRLQQIATKVIKDRTG